MVFWWLAGLMECMEAVENFLFGYWGFELTEYLGLELSGYWGLELSGYWGLELSGNGGLELSEIWDPELSGYWGLESNGYWGNGLPLGLELSKTWDPELSGYWGLESIWGNCPFLTRINWAWATTGGCCLREDPADAIEESSSSKYFCLGWSTNAAIE